MAIDWPELSFKDRSKNREELDAFLSQFIPPPLRPSVGAVNEYLNPVTIQQQASDDSSKFFGSLTDDAPGVDYGAGRDALLGTLETAAFPVAYGLSRTARPLKEALTELFMPLGATDDVVEAGIKGAQIPKVDKTRRNLLLGIASLPVARSIPDILPKKAIKSSVDILKGNIRASMGLEGMGQNLSRQASEISLRQLDELLNNRGNLPINPKSLDSSSENILQQQSDEVFEQLKEIKDAIANSSIDDLRKLSDTELDRINQMLYFEPNSRIGTGDALREKAVKEKLIKVLEERGRHKPFSFLDDIDFKTVGKGEDKPYNESSRDLLEKIQNAIPKPINTDVIKQMVSGGEDFVPLKLNDAQKDAYDFIGRNNDRIQHLLDPEISVEAAVRRAGNLEDVPIDREELKQIIYYLKTKPPEQLDLPLKVPSEDFKDRRYHFSLGDVDQSSIKKFSMEVLEEKRALRDADPDLKDTFIRGNENIDLLGLHVGPLKEAQNRQSALSRDFRTRLNIAKNEFPEKIVEVDLGDGDVVTKVKGDPYDDLDGLTGSTYYPLQVNLSKPFTNPNSADGVWEDFELAAEIQKRKDQDLINNVEKNEGLDRAIEVDREQIKKVRRELAEEGYTNIPYVYGNQFAPRKNITANSEEISQIMLIDQPKNKTIIKSAITGEPMAEGGLVSLTHVARDMFRGPQGIDTFQQFIAKPQRPMVG